MNSCKIFLLISFFLFSFMDTVSGQLPDIDIGIFENPSGSGTLEIRARPTDNFTQNWSAVVFTIRWLDSYGVSLLNPTSSFFISKDNGEVVSGGFRYQKFARTFTLPVNWTANQEVVIMTINHDGMGMGSGTFELANDSWTNDNNGDHYEELNGADQTGVIYASGVSVLLPVDLVQFSANALNSTDAVLDWTTASEFNSSHFTIERSNNGNKWVDIGNVNAAGQSDQELNYSLIDKGVFDPLKLRHETFYYRLRMVDLNGEYEYSDVREVSFESESGLVIGEVYPNPTNRTNTTVSLPVSTDTESFMEIAVYDIQGRIVNIFTKDLLKGNNVLDIEMNQYSAGAYFLKLTTGNLEVTKKIVVQ